MVSGTSGLSARAHLSVTTFASGIALAPTTTRRHAESSFHPDAFCPPTTAHQLLGTRQLVSHSLSIPLWPDPGPPGRGMKACACPPVLLCCVSRLFVAVFRILTGFCAVCCCSGWGGGANPTTSTRAAPLCYGECAQVAPAETSACCWVDLTSGPVFRSVAAPSAQSSQAGLTVLTQGGVSSQGVGEVAGHTVVHVCRGGSVGGNQGQELRFVGGTLSIWRSQTVASTGPWNMERMVICRW